MKSNMIVFFSPDDESPMVPAATVDAAAVEVVGGGDHQLTDNFQNMNLKEKKYKIKRIPFNSIEACLNNFTECEVMDESNKVACVHCATNTKATKQYLISVAPTILILHLKRFEFGDHDRIRKISHHVKFPLRLDLSPYRATRNETFYSLYAVVQHSQRGKNNGHYIAFVKVRPGMATDDPRWQLASKANNKEGTRSRKKPLSRSNSNTSENASKILDEIDEPFVAPNDRTTQWYRVSDTDVKPVTEDSVLKIQAYLLFYERE